MVYPCGINSITMHPSASQKSIPMVFIGWGHCSGFFFLHDVCDAIPCSVIFFPDQSGCCKQSCHLWQHTVPLILRKYFFTEVCAPPSASEKCSRNSFKYPKICTIFWTTWYIPVSAAISLPVTSQFSLTRSSISLLLFLVQAVCKKPQRGWLAVSVFLPTECFTHHLTLLVPMHTSPYTQWSHAWISDVGTFSFTRNLITESCQHSMSLSTIFSCWNMTTWQRQAMWFSF